MNRPILIILLAIAAVFIFVLGGGLGIWYQTQKDAPQLKEAQKAESVVKFLNSKVSSSINARGIVEKISGRNITLSFEGENIEIRIKEDAKIYSFNNISESAKKTSSDTLVQTKNTFESIKMGDDLFINFRALPEGILEGQSVTILPSVPVQ